MTKFSTLDKNNVKELRTMMEEAFTDIYRRTGVKISVGNIGYTPNTLNSKLSAVLVTEGSAEDGMTTQEISFRRSFDNLHSLYGLEKGELGKAKMINGELIVLAGLLPTNRKYPLVGKRKNGGFIKMTPGAWK